MSFLNSFFRKKQSQSFPISILPCAEFLEAVIDKEVQLIDVRTPREYDSEHIKGAVNIDWFQPFKFKSVIEKFDKDKPVYIYCRTGNRSQKAARKLSNLGFLQIYDLEDGITAVK
jgi:rhodanese-related sulfurtransferase